MNFKKKHKKLLKCILIIFILWSFYKYYTKNKIIEGHSGGNPSGSWAEKFKAFTHRHGPGYSGSFGAGSHGTLTLLNGEKTCPVGYNWHKAGASIWFTNSSGDDSGTGWAGGRYCVCPDGGKGIDNVIEDIHPNGRLRRCRLKESISYYNSDEESLDDAADLISPESLDEAYARPFGEIGKRIVNPDGQENNPCIDSQQWKPIWRCYWPELEELKSSQGSVPWCTRFPEVSADALLLMLEGKDYRHLCPLVGGRGGGGTPSPGAQPPEVWREGGRPAQDILDEIESYEPWTSRLDEDEMEVPHYKRYLQAIVNEDWDMIKILMNKETFGDHFFIGLGGGAEYLVTFSKNTIKKLRMDNNNNTTMVNRTLDRIKEYLTRTIQIMTHKLPSYWDALGMEVSIKKKLSGDDLGRGLPFRSSFNTKLSEQDIRMFQDTPYKKSHHRLDIFNTPPVPQYGWLNIGGVTDERDYDINNNPNHYEHFDQGWGEGAGRWRQEVSAYQRGTEGYAHYHGNWVIGLPTLVCNPDHSFNRGSTVVHEMAHCIHFKLNIERSTLIKNFYYKWRLNCGPLTHSCSMRSGEYDPEVDPYPCKNDKEFFAVATQFWFFMQQDDEDYTNIPFLELHPTNMHNIKIRLNHIKGHGVKECKHPCSSSADCDDHLPSFNSAQPCRQTHLGRTCGCVTVPEGTIDPETCDGWSEDPDITLDFITRATGWSWPGQNLTAQQENSIKNTEFSLYNFMSSIYGPPINICDPEHGIESLHEDEGCYRKCNPFGGDYPTDFINHGDSHPSDR